MRLTFLEAGEARGRKCIDHALVDLGAPHAQVLGTEGDLVHDTAGHQLAIRILEYHTDKRRQTSDARSACVIRAHNDLPRELAFMIMRHEPVDAAAECCLSAAGWSRDQHDLPWRDRYMNAL